MDFSITWQMISLLFFLSVSAGFIDAIAGGGGLITVPGLIAAGLPPTQALATNKLQSIGGTFSSTLYFAGKNWINWQHMKLPIIATFIGSACGTILIQSIDTSLLKEIIPFMLFGVAAFFFFFPQSGPSKTPVPRIGLITFSLTAALFIGFYDGALGPGTGSFLTVAFILLLGYSATKAVAHSKLLNFTSNLASLIFFIKGGFVIWPIGLCMMAGQFIGARVGANMVFVKGVKLVRPLIIVMSCLLTIKLILENYYTTV